MNDLTSKTPPGAPGVHLSWTSSAKLGIGTAMSGDSNVWFSLSHGILNEVFFPRIDIANLRDFGFIVTDGKEFFSEEKQDCVHDYAMLAEGIPAHRLTNTCKEGRYRIIKTIITDPNRNVLLQHISFEPLIGSLKDYRLYALIAPHVKNESKDNTGWIDDYKGHPFIYAARDGLFMAITADIPLGKMTCGYVGEFDAWHDLKKNYKLTQMYTRAENGHLCLAVEVPLHAGGCVIGLGFGFSAHEAALQARASTTRDFTWVLRSYIAQWEKVQSEFSDLAHYNKELASLYRTSTQVLKTHQGKHYSGSIIASLSIPWGDSRTDCNVGGYHLIWPRDQVQAAFAFLAANDIESAREVLLFLMCTQEKDGHWNQCMWGEGDCYWKGIQMDETALPILLADQITKRSFLQGLDPWPMVEKAARYILKYGPYTEQGRWEEEAGYNPYTIATQIAALLVAAEFFERKELHEEAQYLRETADWWNERIEDWVYVTDTWLAKEIGVDGYYVRAASKDLFDGTPQPSRKIWIANRPAGEDFYPYEDIVCVDALALVRFGLRRANDPRIVNTVKVIDELLKVETIRGPIWHRYNEDGYGEHNDGRPYDGTGHGRGWPLLTGERAMYELANGNKDAAEELCRNLVNFAGVGGLLPEQIWDSSDIPERSLFNGHSSGSAKPLTWAHAEYITLLRSLSDGKAFGVPEQTLERYVENTHPSKIAIWHPGDRIRTIRQGQVLRIQQTVPFTLTFQNKRQEATHLLGIYYIDIGTQIFPTGTEVRFTLNDSTQVHILIIV